MESKFIELHDRETGDLFSINIQHIVSCGKDGVILTGIPTDIALATAESYDEIKELIKDSGILIHRADPRLNTEWELTLSELREMIGEPVWNSNVLHWYLVDSIQTDPDGSNEKVILRTRGGAELPFDEDDLIKYPLYRMRRE